jgi:hypothetical protein
MINSHTGQRCKILCLHGGNNEEWLLQGQHGVVISQKTAFLIVTAVTTSNLTYVGTVGDSSE